VSCDPVEGAGPSARRKIDSQPRRHCGAPTFAHVQTPPHANTVGLEIPPTLRAFADAVIE
jgi:hypothetical protein